MYVYILTSLSNPTKSYIGLSENFKKRLRAHNNGQSKHTSKYRPWKIQTVIWFDDKDKARSFERYLKSGSGSAFRNKRL